MNIIKQIIDESGYLTGTMLLELAREFPKTPVVIKWVNGPSTTHSAIDAPGVIYDAEKVKLNNHALDVYLCAANTDKLRTALGEHLKNG